MTAAVVPSPLGLFLRHSRQDDPSADEVLILSYNHDLGFLERLALGVVQQAGARITIVADASVAHHDLYAVRHAGTAYLPGTAYCPGAFHPKVLVIAGRERATVAIGSGNLTLAGWQGNDELWTIHHADRTGGSAVVAAAGAWLADLATVVRLSEGAPEALNRLAAVLTGLAGDDTTARFVSSLRTPIIDQLPEGPVDELLLYAPFHDPRASAVAALFERFAPGRVAVAVQPGLTDVNGPALAAVLPASAEIVTLAEHPYRHGKLVEWARGDERWALTGSANLSRAALLRTTVEGGNVEVGVIAPTATSLFPEGVPVAKSTLTTLPPKERHDDPHPSIIVLSAVRNDGAVRLLLARPMPLPGVIQLSPAGAIPDQWQNADEVEAEALEAWLSQDANGGGRVRIRLSDGSVSQPVFIIDPERILRVRAASSGGPRPPELEQVLSDPRAAEQLWRILDDLRQNHGRLSVPATGGGGGAPRSKDGATFEVGDWEEYLERCQGRLGAATMAFAFGIPVIVTRSGTIVTDINWDDDPLDDDEAGGLEDDDTETAAEEQPKAPTLAPSLHRATEAARRRYRKVAENVVRKWADPEPHERLLALRLVLVLVAAGAWPPGDSSWAELVLDAAGNLDVGLDTSDYEEAAGSLGALGLSVVQSALPLQGLTPLRARFEQTADRIGHLLVAANEKRIVLYAEGLAGRFPASSDPAVVMERLEKLINDDPLADATDRLIEQGLDVTVAGRIVRLNRPESEPLRAAYQALAETDEVSPVAIQAPGKNGWATLLWRRPDLVTVRSGTKPDTFYCVHFKYSTGTRPSADIRYDGVPASHRKVTETMAGKPLPDCAVDILADVGLTGPAPMES